MKNKPFTIQIDYKGELVNGKPIKGRIKMRNLKPKILTRNEILSACQKDYDCEINNDSFIIKAKDITTYIK